MRTLLCLLFFTTCYAQDPIQEALAQIPPPDKKRLERLFQHLIFDEPFAYTLFGTKPFSFTEWPFEFFLEYRYPAVYEVCLKGDWSIWEKYKHLFPIKKYAFYAHWYDNVFEIDLFNLEECKKTIATHLKIFQKKMHCGDSPEKILCSIQECPDVFDGLGKSQALYGTLLGFGRNNAQYYENLSTHKMYFLTPLKMFNPEPVISVFKIRLPDFASIENAETEQLRKDYVKQREQITEIYSQGDLLEITLRQLTAQ